VAPSDSEPASVVTGTILIPRSGTAFLQDGATLTVTVEDDSVTDTTSVVVARSVVEVAGRPALDAQGISYSVVVPHAALTLTHRYVIRARISRQASGPLRAGDLLSTQAHPVAAAQLLALSLVERNVEVHVV
jgi:uncharacterized lipoprotein YbaY